VIRHLVVDKLFVLAVGELVDGQDPRVAPLMKKYPDHFAPATPRRRATDRP
jgi:hypothetical protein